MKTNLLNNRELVNSLKLGKEKSYLFLVKSYHAPLFIYAFHLSSNHALSQDIVQNVFMKTWEKRKNLDVNLSIKSFLYKAVYNDFINQYKKKKSRNTLEVMYIDTVANLAEDFDTALYTKKIELVNSEIEKLPKKCKTIFLLSKREGLTNKEISEFLNISLKTIENQITIAFSKLRKGSKYEMEGILFFLANFRKK